MDLGPRVTLDAASATSSALPDPPCRPTSSSTAAWPGRSARALCGAWLSCVPGPGPGDRLPHAWLPDGRSIYDVLGPGLTLLARPGIETTALQEVCTSRGVPLDVAALLDDGLVRRYRGTPCWCGPTSTSSGPGWSCRATPSLWSTA